MTVTMRRGEHVIIRRREKPQVPTERGGGRKRKDWRDELDRSADDRGQERKKGR